MAKKKTADIKKEVPELENRQVAVLKDGRNGIFWQTIRGIVDNERVELEREIMENEDLTDKQRDDLRRWRNFLVYFVDLPEKCIAAIDRAPVNDGSELPQNDSDPYEQPLAEVRDKIINGHGK